MIKKKMPQMVVRLPEDLKAWVEEQSERNFSSQNSEIVRAVRDRKERLIASSGS